MMTRSVPTNQVVTQHDRMTREIERTTERTTLDWFKFLDKHSAHKRGVVGTIEFLRDTEHLPHMFATTLAWNYFNPSTLPGEIAHSIDDKHATDQLRVVHELPAL